MAKIDIEKKKDKNNSSIWLWIIGILIIAGIVWWIAADNDEPEVEEAAVIEQRISENREAGFIDIEKAAGNALISYA